MKIELISGCTSGGLWIDDKSAYDYPSEELLEILHNLLDKADKDILTKVVGTILQCEGKYECDEEPCEQCNDYRDSYTIELEEETCK